MINQRKLAEQQKNQRALKIKKRILKQTHDNKLAESLSPITYKLDEVKKSTEKLREIVKEIYTPQLAIENTQNALPIENEQIQPGVVYDTSIGNSLIIMKKILDFFNIEQRVNGNFFGRVFQSKKWLAINLRLMTLYMILLQVFIKD